MGELLLLLSRVGNDVGERGVEGASMPYCEGRSCRRHQGGKGGEGHSRFVIVVVVVVEPCYIKLSGRRCGGERGGVI
jgi:hypothetical protein